MIQLLVLPGVTILVLGIWKVIVPIIFNRWKNPRCDERKFYGSNVVIFREVRVFYFSLKNQSIEY
jgi:hypothetical protein